MLEKTDNTIIRNKFRHKYFIMIRHKYNIYLIQIRRTFLSKTQKNLQLL